jgi:hypothetical protein
MPSGHVVTAIDRSGGEGDVSTLQPPVRTLSDPIDELVERVRPIAQRAVDELQIAASLESGGITDNIAKAQFGCSDVFILADEVRRRAGPAQSAAVVPHERPHWTSATRDVAHGLLYLLPAAVFPVGLASAGSTSLTLSVVLVGALGWMWSGGSAWLAYRLLGRGFPGAAGRVLAWATLAGVVAAVAMSAAVVITTGAGSELIALAAGQIVFQLASTVLMFYRREVLMFWAMGPGIAGGIVYLAGGSALLPLAIVLVVVSLAAAWSIALLQTRKRATGAEPALRVGLHGEWAQFLPVVLYAAFSAAFLLHAQARYMVDRFDILVAFLPLFVGMGVVEWRARRFGEQARARLSLVRSPREFVGEVWLLLARNVALCCGAVAVLAVVLLAVLRVVASVDPAAVVVAVACVVLAAAYFLGFLLANLAMYWSLCGALAASAALHVLVVFTAPQELQPLVDTKVFLGSVVLLLVLFLAALAGPVSQVRSHR